MKHITGLIGREDLLKEVLTEIRKGKHVLLSGPVGVGKSALLEEAARALERRQADQSQLGLFDDAEAEGAPPAYAGQERRRSRKCVLIYLHEHTGKAQFVAIARRLLETGLLKPSTLDLAKTLDAVPPGELEWAQIRRQVNRLSMKDLADGIIPAINAFRKDSHGTVIICVDDMTRLTPTQQAFWLAVYEHAQIVGCASSKKAGVRKLWWKMKEIAVPPLSAEAAHQVVKEYIERQGTLIETPELYISHVVKQSGGNPQALYDMVDESAKERVIDKRKIREMRHQAGVRYVNFSFIGLFLLAAIMASRYLAIGTGDKTLYVLAGMGMAVALAFRVFMFKGMGKAN